MLIIELLLMFQIWSEFELGARGDPIHVGILDSAYPSWIEVLDQYNNASTFVTSTQLNETVCCGVDTVNTVLEMVKRAGVVATVGEYNSVYASVADHLRMPYFITSPVPVEQQFSPHHIRLVPDIRTYTLAIRDVFQHFSLRDVGVLYDTAYGSKIAALMVEHLHGRRDLYDVRSYNLQHNASADVVRWALKDLRTKLVSSFLIICSPSATNTVLTQALYLSLLSRPNSWLVVDMGPGEASLYEYIDSRANLTLLRLMVDPMSPECALNESDISLTKAVLYDVFYIINGTNRTGDERVSVNNLRRRLKTLGDVNGCTGNLNFSKTGERNETFLQMLTLEGLVSGESGTWRSGKKELSKRVQPSTSFSTMLREKNDLFGDKVLRITTKIEEPFIQWKNKSADEKLHGNEWFDGFCVDILEEISKLLNFKYNITLVPDGKFGSKKWYGWTGMINELIHDRADVALAPFSITPERSEVVDFTEPFMTKGTSVVVKKPERSVWPFQFLSPFSRLIWVTIFISFMFVGVFLFAVTRITSDRKAVYTEDLRESFWYVWGTLLRADLKGSPTTTSGRLVSAAWWFFSLIIISIYTANLAAFLTITNAHIPISSAADLAHQDEYDYGTVDGSQIESFFEHTKINHYEKMWAYMSSPYSKVRRVEDGFARVMKSKYAFIWDSPTVRHETANNCGLMEIGTPFDLKGYGIATQKNAFYSERLSLAVLELHDNGMLYKLEGKWWRRPNCPDHRSNAKSKEIEIEVASGMFIVLCGGLILSVIVCITETILRKKCDKCKSSSDEMPDMDFHPNNNVTSPLDDRKDQSVLARTLSLGDSRMNTNRWDNRMST